MQMVHSRREATSSELDEDEDEDERWRLDEDMLFGPGEECGDRRTILPFLFFAN
jgi:hypothetical protein